MGYDTHDPGGRYLEPRRQELRGLAQPRPGSLIRGDDDVLDATVGASLLLRLVEDQWIHRRVDVIRLVGPSRVRRHVSLDVEVPLDLGRDGTVSRHQRPSTVVPLAYLPKTKDENDQRILRDFDARVEDGYPVPILGRREGTVLAWSTLVAAANRAVGNQAKADLLPLELDLLWAIAASPSAHAWRLRREVLRLSPPDDAQLCPTLVNAASSHSFAYLISRLANDYMLLADLGDVTVSARRVIKYAYDENWPGPHDESDSYPPTDGVAYPLNEGDGLPLLRRLLGRFGIAPTPTLFELASPIPCKSYHFEFEAPDGLEIISSQLHAVRPIPGQVEIRSQPDARIAQHRTVTHVHMPTIASRESLAAEIWLKTVRSSGPVMTVLGGFLLTLGLLAGGQWPEVIVHSSSVVIPVALALPGILAGSVLARHSHDVVGRLGWGMQLLTGLILLVSVGAVVSLAATAVYDPDHGALDLEASAVRLAQVWHVLWPVAGVITLFLLPSLRPYRLWGRGLP